MKPNLKDLSPSHPAVVAEANAKKAAERAKQLAHQRRHGNVKGSDRFWRELEKAHGR